MTRKKQKILTGQALAQLNSSQIAVEISKKIDTAPEKKKVEALLTALNTIKSSKKIELFTEIWTKYSNIFRTYFSPPRATSAQRLQAFELAIQSHRILIRQTIFDILKEHFQADLNKMPFNTQVDYFKMVLGGDWYFSNESHRGYQRVSHDFVIKMHPFFAKTVIDRALLLLPQDRATFYQDLFKSIANKLAAPIPVEEESHRATSDESSDDRGSSDYESVMGDSEDDFQESADRDVDSLENTYALPMEQEIDSDKLFFPPYFEEQELEFVIPTTVDSDSEPASPEYGLFDNFPQ